MQVVILCGGKGTRLNGASTEISKPMLPVGEIPILEHVMRIYAAQGFNNFILLLGFKSDSIINYFSKKELDWEIEYEFTGLDTKTGKRVELVKDLLKDTFFLTYADGLADINLHSLLKFHNSHKGMGTITTTNLPSQYGIFDINGENKILKFEEKPIIKNMWINGGFFVFDKKVFDFWKGEDLESEILPYLAEKQEIYAYKHHGFWESMDTYKDFQKLNELWKNGMAKWTIG